MGRPRRRREWQMQEFVPRSDASSEQQLSGRQNANILVLVDEAAEGNQLAGQSQRARVVGHFRHAARIVFPFSFVNLQQLTNGPNKLRYELTLWLLASGASYAPVGGRDVQEASVSLAAAERYVHEHHADVWLERDMAAWPDLLSLVRHPQSRGVFRVGRGEPVPAPAAMPVAGGGGGMRSDSSRCTDVGSGAHTVSAARTGIGKLALAGGLALQLDEERLVAAMLHDAAVGYSCAAAGRNGSGSGRIGAAADATATAEALIELVAGLSRDAFPWALGTAGNTDAGSSRSADAAELEGGLTADPAPAAAAAAAAASEAATAPVPTTVATITVSEGSSSAGDAAASRAWASAVGATEAAAADGSATGGESVATVPSVACAAPELSALCAANRQLLRCSITAWLARKRQLEPAAPLRAPLQKLGELLRTRQADLWRSCGHTGTDRPRITELLLAPDSRGVFRLEAQAAAGEGAAAGGAAAEVDGQQQAPLRNADVVLDMAALWRAATGHRACLADGVHAPPCLPPGTVQPCNAPAQLPATKASTAGAGSPAGCGRAAAAAAVLASEAVADGRGLETVPGMAPEGSGTPSSLIAAADAAHEAGQGLQQQQQQQQKGAALVNAATITACALEYVSRLPLTEVAQLAFPLRSLGSSSDNTGPSDGAGGSALKGSQNIPRDRAGKMLRCAAVMRLTTCNSTAGHGSSSSGGVGSVGHGGAPMAKLADLERYLQEEHADAWRTASNSRTSLSDFLLQPASRGVFDVIALPFGGPGSALVALKVDKLRLAATSSEPVRREARIVDKLRAAVNAARAAAAAAATEPPDGMSPATAAAAAAVDALRGVPVSVLARLVFPDYTGGGGAEEQHARQLCRAIAAWLTRSPDGELMGHPMSATLSRLANFVRANHGTAWEACRKHCPGLKLFLTAPGACGVFRYAYSALPGGSECVVWLEEDAFLGIAAAAATQGAMGSDAGADAASEADRRAGADADAGAGAGAASEDIAAATAAEQCGPHTAGACSVGTGPYAACAEEDVAMAVHEQAQLQPEVPTARQLAALRRRPVQQLAARAFPMTVAGVPVAQPRARHLRRAVVEYLASSPFAEQLGPLCAHVPNIGAFLRREHSTAWHPSLGKRLGKFLCSAGSRGVFVARWLAEDDDRRVLQLDMEALVLAAARPDWVLPPAAAQGPLDTSAPAKPAKRPGQASSGAAAAGEVSSGDERGPTGGSLGDGGKQMCGSGGATPQQQMALAARPVNDLARMAFPTHWDGQPAPDRAARQLRCAIVEWLATSRQSWGPCGALWAPLWALQRWLVRTHAETWREAVQELSLKEFLLQAESCAVFKLSRVEGHGQVVQLDSEALLLQAVNARGGAAEG